MEKSGAVRGCYMEKVSSTSNTCRIRWRGGIFEGRVLIRYRC